MANKLFKLIELILKKEINIVLNEYISLETNYNYFKTYGPHNIIAMRNDFNLDKLFREMKNNFYAIEEVREQFSKQIKKLSENNNKHETIEIYNDIFFVRTKLKSIIRYLNFAQRKINYLIDSYPPYFPTTTIYRTKQELKSYHWLRSIFVEFYNWISEEITEPQNTNEKNKITRDDVIINWSADDENYFHETYKEDSKLFLFEGSYYLINRQSMWIIMFHEAIHFLINKELNSGLKYKLSDFLKIYLDLKQKTNQLLMTFKTKGAIKLNFMDIHKLYDDVFCDSILTYLLQEKYFIPLFTDLVLHPSSEYPSDSLFFPMHDTFWIRLMVASNFLDGNKIQYQPFLKKIKTDIEKYTYDDNTKQYIISDNKIVDVFQRNFEYLITKVDLLYKFKEINNKNKHIYLKNLLIGQELFVDRVHDLLDNNDDDIDEGLNEGRIIVNQMCLADWEDKFKVKDNDENEDSNKKVIQISFMKTRLNGYGKIIDNINDSNCLNFDNTFEKLNNTENNSVFFNLGPYQFIKINEPNNDIKEKIEIINGLNLDDNEDKKPLYIKHEIVGHIVMYNNGKTNRSDKNLIKLLKADNYNYLIVLQFKIEVKKGKKYKKYDDFFNDIIKRIKELFLKDTIKDVTLLQSSAWFDFLAIIRFNEKNITENLKYFKKELYNTNNANETNIFIKNTITDIAIKKLTHNDINDIRIQALTALGCNPNGINDIRIQALTALGCNPTISHNDINDILIPIPSIFIRFASENKDIQGSIKKLRKKMQNDVFFKQWKMKKFFGIYDFIIYKCNNKDNYNDDSIKLKDFMRLYKLLYNLNCDEEVKKYVFSDIQIRLSVSEN